MERFRNVGDNSPTSGDIPEDIADNLQYLIEMGWIS
jgi:hypothetical protein